MSSNVTVDSAERLASNFDSFFLDCGTRRGTPDRKSILPSFVFIFLSFFSFTFEFLQNKS